MAAVEITISGILYDKLNRTQQQVVLVGEGSLTGLGVGGGPMPPGPGQPPSIWPSPGHPEHPIYWPPSVWPPPGRPVHPIVLPPDPPTEPPTEPPTNPPSENWVWGFSPTYQQWTVVYVPPEGAAGPKA